MTIYHEAILQYSIAQKQWMKAKGIAKKQRKTFQIEVPHSTLIYAA